MKIRLLRIIALALAVGAPLLPAADKGCSKSTIQGAYGYTVTGSGPSGAPFAAVGRIIFNGSGGVMTTRTLSNAGMIVRGDTGSGTYSVNNDCTGTFSINATGLGQLMLDLVVDDDGEEIRAIVTNPGFVLTLEGKKQSDKSH